jgi:hypothetical protein
MRFVNHVRVFALALVVAALPVAGISRSALAVAPPTSGSLPDSTGSAGPPRRARDRQVCASAPRPRASRGCGRPDSDHPGKGQTGSPRVRGPRRMGPSASGG